MPLRSCLVCGEVGRWQGARCPRHQLKAWHTSQQDRAYFASPEWKRIRAQVLHEEPTCTWVGCSLPSVTVDHILNRARGGRHERANLQALCAPHHKAKTAKESAIGRAKAWRGGWQGDKYCPG